MGIKLYAAKGATWKAQLLAVLRNIGYTVCTLYDPNSHMLWTWWLEGFRLADVQSDSDGHLCSHMHMYLISSRKVQGFDAHDECVTFDR